MEIHWPGLKCGNVMWYMNMNHLRVSLCHRFSTELLVSFPSSWKAVFCFGGWRMEQLSQWLWKQEYWLPPGIRWEDMEKMEGSRRPLPRDLLLALPLALGFIMLRYAFERWLMTLSSLEGFKCNLTRFDNRINNRIWVKLEKVPQYHCTFFEQKCDFFPPIFLCISVFSNLNMTH